MEAIDTRLKLYVAKQRLLDDKEVWGAILPEVEALPDEIELTAYLPQLRPCLETLREAYHADDGDKIIAAKETLALLASEIWTTVEMRCYPVFVKVTRSAEPGVVVTSIVNFPLHVLGVFRDATEPDVAEDGEAACGK